MSHTNFLGIPVEGDINKGESRVPQRPLSELEPLLRAVVDDDGIAAFGWTQYTPYFMDGDPCVFGINELWFKTLEDKEDEDNYHFDLSGHPTLGDRVYDYVKSEYTGYKGPDEARFMRCFNLSNAIGSGAWDDVLLEAFGDHAEVTVKRSGITVKFYSHD